MKPAKIHELVSAYDTRELARVRAEEERRVRHQGLREQVGGHREKLGDRIAKLTGFVKATTEGLKYGDGMTTTIVLKRHESPVHGPGTVVAAIKGVDGQNQVATVGQEYELAGYKVDFEFRYTGRDGGEQSASLVEGQDLSEEYNTSKIFGGVDARGEAPFDEAAAEQAIRDAELAEMYFDDTWELLDGSARDPLLNPGIAPVYNERCPLPAAA